MKRNAPSSSPPRYRGRDGLRIPAPTVSSSLGEVAGRCGMFDGCINSCGLSDNNRASPMSSTSEAICCTDGNGSNNDDHSNKRNNNGTTSTEESVLLSTLTKQKLKTPEEVDTLLANELNSLSIDERRKVLEEVHGVLEPQIETTEFIQERLDRLDKEIQKIRKKSSYDLAMFMSPSYVTSRKFRLMFLRAETNYNPSLAALKLVNHFEYKLELYGLNNLVKDITQQDLITIHNQEEEERTQEPKGAARISSSTIEVGSDSDTRNTTATTSTDDREHSTLLSALQTGATQRLPIKDQVGRTIMVSCWRYLPSNVKHQVQSWWYLIMSALQSDEETQKRGIVDIIYHVEHSTSEKDRQMMLQGSKYVQGVPFRHASMHFCYDSHYLHPVLSLTQVAIGKEGRLRFRSHYGSHMECQYALSSFGIKESHFPLGMDGKLKASNHLKYLKELKIKEDKQEEERKKQSEATGVIDYPVSTDIVLGRGKPYHVWVGNVRLANLVEEHRSEYQKSSRSEKTAISNYMLEIVRGWNGRFLKRADDGNEGDDDDDTQVVNGSSSFSMKGWVEVSNDVAREKVSHSFRTKTKKTQQAFTVALYPGVTTTSNINAMVSSATWGTATQTKRPRR